MVRDISRADTIDAEPSARMVIEVTGPDGRLNHNVVVNVAGIPSPADPEQLGMLAMDTLGTQLGSIALTTSRQTSFRVKFGRRAGPAAIRITVPELELADSISFTVMPGDPAFIRLEPGDTAVMIGNSFTQDAIIIDRGGNDLGLHATFSSSSPAVTVASTGKVDGSAVGRAGIAVRYVAPSGLLQETAMVSVVPRGEIAQAISAPGATVTSAIGIRRTDGTMVRSYPTPQAPFEPIWSADATKIYYAGTDQQTNSQRLYSLNIADGAIQPIVPDTVSALNGRFLAWPAASRDGMWIYFTAQEPGNFSSVWRIHPDGTGAEKLVGDAPPPGDFRFRNCPTPSPDGTRLAYTEKSVTANDVDVLDLTTRAVTVITGTGADEVRWSPTGNRLATRGGAGLYVVNPDGSGLREIAGPISYFGGLDWSPDGAFISVKMDSKPNIVDPDNGLFLPVPLDGSGLAWSPK
ncbi:MAG TPA: hypothetical protein VJ825_01240 [Gemmatimonadaceae bacterium]|nr:hypothetical protein [Gemmatimonadaceae bacterium]